MRISIHPRLVEEAVFQACRRAPEGGEWLRRSLDRAYRLPEGAERDLRFERVHAVAFRRMGLAKALHGIFAAHPALALAEGAVRIGPAPGRAKEGVDLHERLGVDGRRVRSVLASVLPATLSDPAAAARRLHRDAMKTADLLDPAFAWTEEPAEPTPARRESVRLRYGAAWDAWTDGRLERRGLPSPVSREEGALSFAMVFVGPLGEEGARAAFEAARAREAWTHAGILALARNPDGRTPDGGRATGRSPGSSCPLCRFPTHDWEPDPAGLPPDVAAAVRRSDAGWTPEQGICGQCTLLFRGQVRLARTAESLPA